MDSQSAWLSETSSPVVQAPVIFSQAAEVGGECSDCEERPVVFKCPRCPLPLCEICWHEKPTHKRGAVGHQQLLLDGSPVEDQPNTLRLLEQALKSDWSQECREEQHRADYTTVWFAITQSDQESLSIESFARFRDLIHQHRQSHPTVEHVYPRLVSFMGGSGVGKSTLIHAIVRQLWVPTAEGGFETSCQVAAPVIGDDSAIPTSSDVRLYGDPIGSRDGPENPILFADCEGFDGLSRSAAANVLEQDNKANRQANHQSEGSAEGSSSRFINRTWDSIRRKLQWSGDVKGRRYSALEQLFPRLLYNVSDVLVYVISEAEKKQLGGVLQRLADWSQKSATAAINRTSLPSLIVVLNRSDPNSSDWEPDETTNRLFHDHLEVLQSVLGHCFSSVNFIRIPHRKDLARLASQTKLLRDMINHASMKAYKAKLASNALLEAEHQNLFCRMAFEHFSQYRDKPFDFIETFFSITPLPTNLANSLANMLLAATNSLVTKERPLHSEALAEILLETVTPVICSAIAIDVHRTYNLLPGSLSGLIQGEISHPDESDLNFREFSYERQIEEACQTFLDMTCSCTYSRAGNSCVNKAVAHAQDRPHQDSWGNDIGRGSAGSYEADDFHNHFSSSWHAGFLRGIDDLDEKRDSLLSKGKTDFVMPMLWAIHNDSILRMHRTVDNLKFPDLLGCFWCLKHVPTERLPCGHWICESCLYQMSETCLYDDRLYVIRRCNRHAGGLVFDSAFEYLRLPSTLGRRLLSLDDGGVRGIVQPVILKEIQEELGREFPVLDCFDLIGGTGSGGIISLGLASSNWRITDAAEKFRQLAAIAFSERNDWSPFFWRSKPTYRSENLAKGVKLAFGPDGESQMTESMSKRKASGHNPARMFVTVSVAAQAGEVVANYHRPRDGGSEKTHFGPVAHAHSCDLSIEAAAQATFSLPGLFDPIRSGKGKEYSGGGPEYSNPARETVIEAQRIWPKASNLHPDVLVSIGTGCLGRQPTSSESSEPRPQHGVNNADMTWNELFGKLAEDNYNRYIRLCPEFPYFLPEIDQIRVLTGANRHMETVTANFLTNDRKQIITNGSNGSQIGLVVRRLVSTTFYFQRTKAVSEGNGDIIISGVIRCRYKNTSDIVKAFGKKIRGYMNACFIIEPSHAVLWSFNMEALDRMNGEGRFHADIDFRLPASSAVVDIRFAAKGFFAESISGCPLPVDDLQKSL